MSKVTDQSTLPWLSPGTEIRRRRRGRSVARSKTERKDTAQLREMREALAEELRRKREQGDA